ncbi:DUF2520 domain-containing protein [Undibacterium amnicola]|uniref:DUF2520 domain-containing protein n=1 Tax=Undibacterium amnicola TaxID=1834038 RepID=A0ABR6XVM4_9BURK|nr:Rossmann-like and DUF2520 domain-containing protein [Undibacterium amnicola]MBC3833522.1 DUF2520 domain-containing protein [Undibacterium amnicola]
MLNFSVIGTGRVGKTLGRLFAQHKVFAISQLFSTSLEGSQRALAFIGQGQPVTELTKMVPADITLLSVPDDTFASVTQSLIDANQLKPGSILFHCSGAKSSRDLVSLCPALAQLSLQLASVHPVRSFAEPALAVSDFSGTICSVEGSPQALDVLIPAFQKIGAETVIINPEHKLLYHAGSVFASNYLVSLLDTAIAAYCAAGIAPDLAKKMAQSLAQNSLANISTLGTRDALTGPIKRGDLATVTAQAAQVAAWNTELGDLYQAFIKPTMHLAKRTSER